MSPTPVSGAVASSSSPSTPQYPQAAIDTAKWMVSDPDHVRERSHVPGLWTGQRDLDGRASRRTPTTWVTPTEAMTIQSQLINPVVGPVRIDVYNQIGSDLALPLTEGQPSRRPSTSSPSPSKNLAPQFGYNVSD